MDETNPTARALVCLQLLQDQPGITADRLADRLGCSPRAARRYVSVLREAGVPVHAERGRYGGYWLGRGVRSAPLLLGQAEALGLIMAVLDGHHDVRDEKAPVGAAVGKLVRSLPSALADQMEAIRATIAAVPDRSAARPDPVTTLALVAAIDERTTLALEYRGGSGSTWDVEVEPWAVVVRHGRWYLLCRVPTRDQVRTYRVDRILRVRSLDSTFEPPDDLDPVALLEAHLAVGWEYEVDVVIEADPAEVRRYLGPVLGRLEGGEEGKTRLIATTGNPWWYAEQLATLPLPFRVVGGPELQHTVRAAGERLLAAVPQGGGDESWVEREDVDHGPRGGARLD